jgi:hypothetical protein
LTAASRSKVHLHDERRKQSGVRADFSELLIFKSALSANDLIEASGLGTYLAFVLVD